MNTDSPSTTQPIYPGIDPADLGPASQNGQNGLRPEISLLRHYIQRMSLAALNASDLTSALETLAAVTRALMSIARLSRIQQLLESAGEAPCVSYQREMEAICRSLEAEIDAEDQSGLDFSAPA